MSYTICHPSLRMTIGDLAEMTKECGFEDSY